MNTQYHQSCKVTIEMLDTETESQDNSEKEEEAVSLLAMLEWTMPLVIHLTSGFDVFLALVYQKYFHAWRRILAPPEPEVGKVQKRAKIV